jgi:[acyl-carrier-protein] S-malonyltransferase
METFLEAGRSTFVEVGPGRVLKGFMRRIERGATTFSIEDQASLDNLFESLEEVC